MGGRKAKWIGVGLLILFGLIFLSNLYREKERALWDFRTYYFAARAFQEGQSPYTLEALSEAAGAQITLPFLYPPFTLFVFLPFTSLHFWTAFQVYFLIKILSVALLFWIWFVFLKRDFDWLFLPFALVAFNSAVPLDVAAGNISSFEQILLWSAFLFYIRGRLLPFCALVVFASLFKLTPLFFLLLLFYSEDRKRIYFLVGSILAFGVILLSGYLLYPDLMVEFSQQVNQTLGDHESRGLWNPSTFALIRDGIYRAMTSLGEKVGTQGAFKLYSILGLGLSLCTFRVLRDSHFRSNVPQAEKNHYRICLLCLLYVLLVPRLQVYSYLVVIPAAFFFLKRWSGSMVYPLSLFFLMSLSARDVFFPGMKQFYDFFWDYSPLIVCAALWIMAVTENWRGHPQKETPIVGME
ncbi:MAG: DUF2029 domain-containing protein [Candidatus Omnitrophica bacterium]|nr:DUF2029 domain-containing protein [Candidatus Omnitrophota bacterium]